MAALVVATALAFLPVLWAGFIWDDDALTDNPQVRSPSGLVDIWLRPSGNPHEAHYWPVVYTTFWLEYRLWGGLHPRGFHLTNLLLHVLNVVLLFHVFRRLTPKGAWFAAAVFALHPVHVESVAWVIERKDVLCTAFYLGAFLLWLRYREKSDSKASEPGTEGIGTGTGAYVGAVVCFVAAMLSKSMAVSFPLALAIWIWWKEGRFTKRDALALAPFFVLGVLIAALDVRYAQGRESAAFGYSSLERIGLMGRALWFYTGKLIVPWPLMTFYPRWEVAIPPLWPLAAPAGVGVVLVALWAARRRIGRAPLALVLFYCVTLGPTLGLIDFHFMGLSYVADRFQYLASAGPILLACAGAVRLHERLPSGGRLGMRVAGGAALAIFFVLTFLHARRHQGDEPLFRHNVRHNNDAWAAHNNLGYALEARGVFDEAARHYEAAVRANPDFPDAHNNLGVALGRRGDLEGAIRHFERVIELRPHRVEAWTNLGYALLLQNDPAAAVEALRRGLDYRPDHAPAYLNLGRALEDLGDAARAAEAYETVLRLDPGLLDAADALRRLNAARP